MMLEAVFEGELSRVSRCHLVPSTTKLIRFQPVSVTQRFQEFSVTVFAMSIC